MGDISSLFYPTLDFSEEGQALLDIKIPRKDYEQKVKEFYEAEGLKEEFEDYVSKINSTFDVEIVPLWDDRLGLRNIKLKPQSGLDLDEEWMKYVQHNVWSKEQAIPLFFVATKYISLIL